MSQKTPPPKPGSRTLPDILQSTPQSQGMSGSEAQNQYAGNEDNKRRMAIDLESTIEVPFASLVTALLARLELSSIANPEDPTALKEAQNKGKLAFDDILTRAIAFCNSSSDRTEQMKTYLREYLLAKNEKDSYKPLASFFNTILLQTEIFYPASAKSDDDIVIFVPSSKTEIPSIEDGDGSKRKPDIVGIPVSCLLSKDPKSTPRTFADLTTQIESEKVSTTKVRWSHVLAATEVKRPRSIKFDPKTLDKVYTRPEIQAEATTSTKAKDKKRKAPEGVEESNVPSKKSGSLRSMTPVTSSTPIRTPPAVQCGYYGLERLRSAWNATHGFLLFVDGVKLQLQYYDPQGLIRTEHVSLLDHLPVVVAMFFMFRRLGDGMWGVPKTELSFEHKEKKISIPFELVKDTQTHQSFHWIGRRTFTADVRWTPDAQDATVSEDACSDAQQSPPSDSTDPDSPDASVSGDTCSDAPSSTGDSQDDPNAPGYALGLSFFKASWPESSRDREPDIVAKAEERANKHLGRYTSYVVDHIPTIHGSNELKQSSTALIRKLLDCDPAITARSRVLLWMVSRKLEHLTKQDIKPFLVGFAQLIRCHFLLWRIGIAHGDISLRNLMWDSKSKKGILNDFDLAAIMEPGDLSPPQKGHQRSGTIPFMALALLANNVPRIYAHDLEGFVWCLFWHCAESSESDLKENWQSHRRAFQFKTTVLVGGDLGEFESKPTCIGAWDFVEWWMQRWGDRRREELRDVKKKKTPASGLQSLLKRPPQASVDVETPEPTKPEGETLNSSYISECWSTSFKDIVEDDQPGWVDFSVVQKAATST